MLEELIPNVYDKVAEIENMWKKEGAYYSYPSLRNYVDHLAEDYELFKWLFEDERFQNYQPWHLPRPYYEAYEEFRMLFFDLD